MSLSFENKKYIIAGGSGFLGVSLAHHLAQQGAAVVILSRSPPRVAGPWRNVKWNARNPGAWQKELDGASGLINLAGRNVNCIKTPDHQDEILRSRVDTTRVLGEALRACDSLPAVWVQMSTAHIYGDPPEAVCSEDSATGFGLAPFVGKAWEEAFQASLLPSQRGVVFRTSFVLGRDRGAGGGALATLSMLARLGLGGKVGAGTQGMSWIHEADMNRLFERALTDTAMQGTYIASSPYPVSQAEFMLELRQAVGMPVGLPAFPWMVRFAARWLLRTDPDLALYGRYVISKRLTEEGFEFRFSRLTEALANLLDRGRSDISGAQSK